MNSILDSTLLNWNTISISACHFAAFSCCVWVIICDKEIRTSCLVQQAKCCGSYIQIFIEFLLIFYEKKGNWNIYNCLTSISRMTIRGWDEKFQVFRRDGAHSVILTMIRWNVVSLLILALILNFTKTLQLTFCSRLKTN